jgi:alkylation response protein AidB-like acyl-CoA dehydrogenase
MDFDFTPEQRAFRAALRVWLRENVARHLPDGPQYSGPEKRWERATRWHRALYEGGSVGIWWPREYGGRGASLIEQYIYEQEMSELKLP